MHTHAHTYICTHIHMKQVGSKPRRWAFIGKNAPIHILPPSAPTPSGGIHTALACHHQMHYLSWPCNGMDEGLLGHRAVPKEPHVPPVRKLVSFSVLRKRRPLRSLTKSKLLCYNVRKQSGHRIRYGPHSVLRNPSPWGLGWARKVTDAGGGRY